jgi:hypothetical protein
MLRTFAARAVLAAASLTLALTGCTHSTDFSITKHYTNVNVTAGSVSGTQHVDLAQEAGGAWKQRSHLKSLDLVAVDATITQINTGATATFSGSVALSRGGSAPVEIGTWSEPFPSSAPHTITVTFNQAGEQLINDAIKSDGQFDVTFTASSGAPVNFNADVTLHVHMTYKVP